MKDELCQVFCNRIDRPVPIRISKRGGTISICCCFEGTSGDCKYRAEAGCALYERFSAKGDPIIQDLSEVLGFRAQVVHDAIKALIGEGIDFVIGGRDAVNAYCPAVVEETMSTDVFIRSADRGKAWEVLESTGFKVDPLDPTCCIAGKKKISIELHYGSPPYKPEYLGEETLPRAVKVRLMDVKVFLQPLEELVAYKADRFTDRDKVDLSRLLDEWAKRIDVKYLRKVARERALSLENLVITEREIKIRA